MTIFSRLVPPKRPSTAESAAPAVQAGTGIGQAEFQDGAVEMIRVLRVVRRSAVLSPDPPDSDLLRPTAWRGCAASQPDRADCRGTRSEHENRITASTLAAAEELRCPQPDGRRAPGSFTGPAAAASHVLGPHSDRPGAHRTEQFAWRGLTKYGPFSRDEVGLVAPLVEASDRHCLPARAVPDRRRADHPFFSVAWRDASGSRTRMPRPHRGALHRGRSSLPGWKYRWRPASPAACWMGADW